MTKYTFVTESHVTGDDKATVDILSHSDVERIADTVAGNVEERLSRRIERTGKAASEAKGEADEARMDAKVALEEARSTAERLANSARDTFRGIVAESLMPVLESGLGQVLAKQEEIQRDHKALQDAAADIRLKFAAFGERDAALERKISNLQVALEAMREEAKAAKEAEDARWDAWDTANDRLHGELDSLREEMGVARQVADGKLAELAGENLRLREDVETLRTEAEAASRATGERLDGLETGIRQLSTASTQADWRKECQALRVEIAHLQRRCAWAVALLLAGMFGLAFLRWGRAGEKPSEMATDVRDGAAPLVQNRLDAGGYTENEGCGIPPEGGEPPVAGDDGETLSALIDRARAGAKEAEIQVGRWILDGRRLEATDEEMFRWVLAAGCDGAEGVGGWLAAQVHDGNSVAQGLLQQARQGDARAQALLKNCGVPADGEPWDTEPGGTSQGGNHVH